MCSETTSPRLSFSYNLPEDGSVPIEAKRQDTTLLDDSNVEFEFSINVENESSCADEVFSNGIILPFTASLPPLPPIAIEIINSKKQMMRMTLLENSSSSSAAAAADHNDHELEQRVSESKSSFWGFKRSSSLNFETRIRPSLCPLPILSRSNSTGSSSLPNSNSKNSKHHSHKHHSASTKKSSSSSSSTSTSASLNQYKAQIMCKNQGGVYGNYGHYIGPVLNVPPKFFGFGSLLRCGMDKKNKK